MSKRYSDAFPNTNSPRLRKGLVVVFVIVTFILLYNGLQFYPAEATLNSKFPAPGNRNVKLEWPKNTTRMEKRMEKKEADDKKKGCLIQGTKN